MSDNTSVVTKQDIQMIMDAMKFGFKEIDLKFKEMDSKFEAKFEESHRHTTILIEDLEDKLIGTNHDLISLHSDKLKNHEKRVSKLETQILYATS